MKKQVIFSFPGQRHDVAEYTVYRLLPNQYAYHVGHFVFLDYVPPKIKNSAKVPNAEFAHPHRGIATLSYVLNGEVEHYDSRGNRSTVHSGGVQWMKTGNGIIHNETMNADSKTNNPYIQGLQFWINLPSKIKKENPEYISAEDNELPVLQLDGDAGWLKVVLGEYDGQQSKIPTYAKQYIYHIHLNAGKQFAFSAEKDLDYALFLLHQGITINGVAYNAADLIVFDKNKGMIEIANTSELGVNIILFGGEGYTEPFVAMGPFVMNTQEEVQQAYTDYHMGKYGEMVYK